MRIFQCFTLLTLTILLSAGITGCSQKFNDVNDTLSLALFGDNDTELASDDVQRLPYASLYAQVDDGPQAFMVLALAEPALSLTPNTRTQLKWVSSDKGMLVTEGGRLVKSLNLPQGNLIETYSNQPDPLILGLQRASTPMHWQRTIDWQPGYHFSYQLTSRFSRQDNAVIMINEHPITTWHFIESVTIDALDTRYQNQFWIDGKTGKVLKSQQTLAPGLPVIDMTLLKPYS
ncbi:YjbF family lipoprotein [Photobacterium frigidiphilum]|uniref:YjbF family lipoprotein n=1 Tax=Photobacterium frigidiphilum TaxID=264736 RepID=A0A2T3JPE5_9GAMM|nr:YjbF family lipoprotein [Photobacterium frigidiphilum]PSU50922.1 YjbF family lipoprotein [Photobacterium frigidiphilum]